jgi:hypothetical protein
MTAMVMDVRELTGEELEFVSGGDLKTAGQYMVLAGGTLAAVGTVASTVAMIPTPVSPMLLGFGGVTRGVGALMVLGGSYYAYGGTFGFSGSGSGGGRGLIFRIKHH